MKNYKTTFESVIKDHVCIIEEYGGNIKDYFLEDLTNSPDNIHNYLTDEEIEQYEKADYGGRLVFINEVKDFLNDYDMYVWDFLGQTPSDRILEYIGYVKSQGNYYELWETHKGALIDEDLDFIDIDSFCRENHIDLYLQQFGYFDCTAGEQQNDIELIQNLAVEISMYTVVIRVELAEKDICNNTQSVYYFFN